MPEPGRETATGTTTATGRQRRLATPIPFIDLSAQNRALERQIREALGRVLETSSFVLGEEVEAFEREFAAFIGVKHAVGVGSGFDALALTLRALGIGKSDEVILPANAHIATAMAVAHAGAKPVFVDVDPVRYTLDPAAVAGAIGRRTRAILPVHLHGQAADIAALKGIASRKPIAILEEVAQAAGATVDGARCGALADAGCFSFYPTKNLGALGDGGLVATDRDDLAESLRRLRNYGQSGPNEHAARGVNSRFDALQAAVLRLKLRSLPRWIEARRRHAGHYAQALGDLPVVTPAEAPGATHTFQHYVIRAPRRDELKASLEGFGVSTAIHWPVPCHLQPAFSDLGFGPGRFPVAERLGGEILSLPLYPEMSDLDVDRICEAVGTFYAQAPGTAA